jgi:membrane fusion protein (multidrug efflux system)
MKSIDTATPPLNCRRREGNRPWPARARGLIWLLLGVTASAGLSGCRRQVVVASTAPPPVQVIVVEARRQPVAETLSLPATITPNETVELKAEMDGIVQEIGFSEGQRVKKGHVLVQLDETKLAAAVSEAEANLKLSQANHARAQQLFQDKLISQQDYDQSAATFAVNVAGLELKKRQLRDARVSAPFSGIVGARQVSPGQVITRDSTLTWLVDLDTVKVEVKIAEKYLRQLEIGQHLEFTVAAFPDEKFRGEVYFISPQIDEGTRTALVKARIPNGEGKLRGGMFASLDLTLQLRESAIVIPEPALMSNGDLFSVFVIDEQGLAQTRAIQVGYRLPGRVEIVKGLAAGEKVVVEGLQKLRPGSAVKFAPAEAAAIYLRTSS